MKSGKNGWILFLIILCAIVVGGFLGEFFKNSQLLGFMGKGFPVGTINPIVVDLMMLKLSLGLTVNVNLASIIALAGGIYLYTRM